MAGPQSRAVAGSTDRLQSCDAFGAGNSLCGRCASKHDITGIGEPAAARTGLAEAGYSARVARNSVFPI
jgi:hypothetical protein